MTSTARGAQMWWTASSSRRTLHQGWSGEEALREAASRNNHVHDRPAALGVAVLWVDSVASVFTAVMSQLTLRSPF